MENSSPVGEYFLKPLLSGARCWEASCFTAGTCFILQLLEVFGSSLQLQALGQLLRELCDFSVYTERAVGHPGAQTGVQG